MIINIMFFLDEIQKIEDFEKRINSLRNTNNYSIFVTCSNSRMTLLKLSTDLSGRYVSFRINPLSFKEIVELTNTKEKDSEKYITTLTKEDYSNNGIKQINIFDF